jgi:hypothetical protein
MSRDKLSYLVTKTLSDLYDAVPDNIDRYCEGTFLDLVEHGGWDGKLSVEVDLEPLSKLDPSGDANAEVANSLLVWKALHGLTPTLACEDRVWSRLSHVECLEYSRSRWLKGKSNTAAEKAIRTHFFAHGITGCRDDHAISRLWWNANIAKNLRPSDQKGALELILKTADIRSNFVERRWTGSRPRVAISILDVMERNPWITEKEANYREFMKVVNARGGGIVFELIEDVARDKFMDECCELALSYCTT